MTRSCNRARTWNTKFAQRRFTHARLNLTLTPLTRMSPCEVIWLLRSLKPDFKTIAYEGFNLPSQRPNWPFIGEIPVMTTNYDPIAEQYKRVQPHGARLQSATGAQHPRRRDPDGGSPGVKGDAILARLALA